MSSEKLPAQGLLRHMFDAAIASAQPALCIPPFLSRLQVLPNSDVPGDTRIHALGLGPHDSLANNDGHGFFQALGNSVVTGPTLTNVNDFRAILIDAPTGN